MKRIHVLLIILFALNACNPSPNNNILVYADQEIAKSLEPGLAVLHEQISSGLFSCEFISDPEIQADLTLRLVEQSSEEVNDGYSLSKDRRTFILSAECERGLLYGMMDVAAALKQGMNWDDLEEKTVKAHYPFRAIKFNLPWYSYRSGKNLSLHYETCRDLDYWEAFLDMMLENKFNALTLWNMHPYMYMVKSESFPESSPFTDEEMQEWKAFWKKLFSMAKQRGIETYVVNWNIFVSKEFSENYGVAQYAESSGFFGDGETNDLIEEYTREMITQTINEYDDLTGIGITLGERMGGMTSEERKDWVERVLIAGLKDADREARLIYRAPLSAEKGSHGSVSVSTEQITRKSIENLGLQNEVLVEFKFNWSHAHSSPKVSIVHGGILTDTYWEPLSDKYRAVWTMRNEDFHVLRWAQPDFIREFMNYNSQPYVAGCIIGSETYIPAKDYITRKEFQSWNYAFERQWLFYKVWGNLLYDKNTSNDYFSKALADKFDLEDGSDLLRAWSLASMNANRMASFFQGTWDATLYTEGFTTVGGKFIGIEQFIAHPVLDSSYVNIQDFVEGNYVPEQQITPLELAELTETECNEALKLITAIRSSVVNQDLEIELTDIEAWVTYGYYFASKLRGGVAHARYQKTGDPDEQQIAVNRLEEALLHWEKLCELVEEYNNPVIPYQFDKEFSWRKHLKDAQHDIEIAKTID